MINRRGLFSLLAAAAGAAAGVMMPPRDIIDRLSMPVLHGDGLHDDTPALQRLLDGGRVWSARGCQIVGCTVENGLVDGGNYLVTRTLYIRSLPDDETADSVITNCTIESSATPIIRYDAA